MLSIVIPTFNEEPRLHLLLESIRKQDFSDDYEIIVADANSKDKTVEIAENYGCKVVSGGLPAKGRNEGARIAKGDLLLFVDGDTILPEDFLSRNLKEFEETRTDSAGFRLCPYRKNRFFHFLYDLLYNWPALATERFLPHASNVILVKKSFHQKIGGFDEEIKIAEDHAYAREGARIGKFRILRSSPTLASTKRFERDGWVKTCFKYALCEFYTVFCGPVKSDIFKYRFAHYEEGKDKNSEAIIGKLARPFQLAWKTIEIATVLVVWMLIILICALCAASRVFVGRNAGRLSP